MTDVSQIVQRRLAEQESAKDEQRRQEVRQATSDYLKKWGLDGTLPAGNRGDGAHCVFANALGGFWDGTTWKLDEQRGKKLAGCWSGNEDEGYVLDMPPEVTEFIARFDRGEYPDLDALAFVEGVEMTTRLQTAGKSHTTPEIVGLIDDRLKGLRLHRRALERALRKDREHIKKLEAARTELRRQRARKQAK